jgi:hypothetical protein
MLVHPGASLRQKLQDRKHLPSLEISKETPFVAFFRIDDVLLKVRNRKARCYTLSLCATTSHILALRLVLLEDMMIESLSLWFQIPV